MCSKIGDNGLKVIKDIFKKKYLEKKNKLKRLTPYPL